MRVRFLADASDSFGYADGSTKRYAGVEGEVVDLPQDIAECFIGRGVAQPEAPAATRPPRRRKEG